MTPVLVVGAVVERVHVVVGALADQAIYADFTVVLVAVRSPLENLPHYQAPLRRCQDAVSLLDDEPVVVRAISSNYKQRSDPSMSDRTRIPVLKITGPLCWTGWRL